MLNLLKMPRSIFVLVTFNAIPKMQHTFLAALDKKDTLAVKVFTIDFSKAFDNVRHHHLVEKWKDSPLNPYIARNIT